MYLISPVLRCIISPTSKYSQNFALKQHQPTFSLRERERERDKIAHPHKTEDTISTQTDMH
jgi:hypothetical protein